MSPVRLVFLTLLVLVTTTPASAMAYQAVPAAKPEEAGLSSEGLAKIPARMQEFVDAHQTAGVVSLVAAKGHIKVHPCVRLNQAQRRHVSIASGDNP